MKYKTMLLKKCNILETNIKRRKRTAKSTESERKQCEHMEQRLQGHTAAPTRLLAANVGALAVDLANKIVEDLQS